MEILQEGNRWALEKYGKIFSEITPKETPKLHRYILTIPSEYGGMLMYNGLTKEIVKFEEGDNLFDEKFFDTLWMVPSDYDEANLAVSLKDNLAESRKKTWYPLSYTILTTTDCNARCFYCYEKGVTKKNMSNETANDVGNYIVSNYLKDNEIKPGEKKQPVNISWFGGEPLFNKQAIDIIIDRLIENGIPYSTSMISNGYLFDEETVKTAKRKWKLKHVQITIDGTNSKYKTAKNYIYDDKDPLETVFKNIDNLLLFEISVSVRINVGYYNHKDISNLITTIYERFIGKKRLSVYLHTLFDRSGTTDITDSEKEEKVYLEMMKLEKDLIELGLSRPKGSSNRLPDTHCMADNGKHAVIQCDGGITLCEHYVDSQKFTSIYSEEKNYEVFEKFRKISGPFERCYFCPLIMECSFLEMCEDNETNCSEIRQRYMIEKKIAEIKGLDKMKQEKTLKAMDETLTKYQETFHFSDANVEERKSIYKDIGYAKVSIISGLNENSARVKKLGIDAIGFLNGKEEKIKEIICNFSYANVFTKRIPIELYSDFENETLGWLAETESNVVFYFFNDAIIYSEIQPLRYFVDKIYQEGNFNDVLHETATAFIENGVSAKQTDDEKGIGFYVTKNEDGHHSVGILVDTNLLPDYAMDITEYYFEEETEESEE